MKMYTELSTAYTDVLASATSTSLKNLPPDAYASAKDVFKDRYTEQASPDITSLGHSTIRVTPMSVSAKHYRWPSTAGNRQRDLPGHPGPADLFAPPTVVGYRANACGRSGANITGRAASSRSQLRHEQTR